ncbi:hypothetical protein [Gorillibacterium massiliense]|uniref:hypothetical protein n=1 Tax=Gorillibacterium massiliense TaxID=1280390 RepID=UPI0005939EC8|nr:hypothetical protein [Gorillibacterium massiliense]
MINHPAWERLYLAVDYLASSNLNLEDRLRLVLEDHLIILREQEFKSVRAKELFNNIIKYKSSIKILAQEPNEDLVKLAKNIVSLLNQITYFEDQD